MNIPISHDSFCEQGEDLFHDILSRLEFRNSFAGRLMSRRCGTASLLTMGFRPQSSLGLYLLVSFLGSIFGG